MQKTLQFYPLISCWIFSITHFQHVSTQSADNYVRFIRWKNNFSAIVSAFLPLYFRFFSAYLTYFHRFPYTISAPILHISALSVHNFTPSTFSTVNAVNMVKKVEAKNSTSYFNSLVIFTAALTMSFLICLIGIGEIFPSSFSRWIKSFSAKNC